MLTKKIPFYSAVLALFSGVIVSFLWLSNIHSVTAKDQQADKQSAAPEAKPDNSVSVSRQKGFEMINPLLSVKPASESDKLAGLKAKLSNLIDDDKRQGVLSSASVYIVCLANSDWTYISPEETFHPGSLMKVAVLMTYLKASEKDPEIFNKKIFYSNPADLPVQTYNARVLEPGRNYTVKELLRYMIAYSDNNATRLLNENADLNLLRKVFTDLNLPEPNLSDINYQTNARNFSEFFTVLYNASYLSRQSSEYAMELLKDCDFKEGMLKELPASVKVAHKFGEWGDLRMNIHELHESGIVYLNSKPYLLTIMTKGNTSKELSMELSKISKIVYDHFTATGG